MKSGGKNNHIFKPTFIGLKIMVMLPLLRLLEDIIQLLVPCYLVFQRVLTPIRQPDRKFFGPTFTRMDNTPLLRTIKKYWDYDKFPIKTCFKNHEPRLLLVSVDALDATSPVAFDTLLL